MATPFRVKAVYEYSSPHEDDLNFSVGQIITVNEQEDDDWYGGEYVDDAGTKHEGIFPRNFVEKFEPTAPPRPTRTRTKKEPEPEPEEPQPIEKPEPTPSSPPVPAPVTEEIHGAQHDEEPETDEPVHRSPQAAAPPPFPAREPTQFSEAAAPVPPPSIPKSTEPAAPAAASSSQTSKPKPKGPPPVAEKPSSNSFKDRIAAFNKPAAPPVAPFKPGGLGGSGGGAPGFVKKPFVAAPPSRNAYVPPPREAPTTKIYRREEDPEVKEAEAQVQEQAEKAGFTSPEQHGDDDEDQPKPTSLKERIALLQKQQMEQAARHADAATKKEKPKKPVRKPTEPVPTTEGEAEDEAPAPLERKYTTDSLPSRTSMDDPHAGRALPTRRKSSTRPILEGPHDGNEADMSGAGDTTEGQDEGTEREESDEVSRNVSRAPTGNLAPQAETRKQEEEEEEDEDEDEDEEDVDPEVRRKEELRARMAKMSGGMGFAGMFGAPMPAPGPAPPKKKKSKPEPAPLEEEEDDETTSRAAPPIPTAMALPGMGGPRKSLDEQSAEEGVQPAARAPPPAPPRPVQEPAGEEDDEEEDNDLTPAPTSTVPTIPPRDPAGPPPPVPGGRPAPPPVPSEVRPAAPAAESPSEGSVSDDELSGAAQDKPTDSAVSESIKSPPPPLPQSPDIHARSPPLSPRFEAPPTSTASKRSSRPPPPIPGAAAPPVPSQSRPPPPPPPGGISRQGTSDFSAPTPMRPPQAGEEHEDEATEYEGDYDTDIASSVPHKDALKAHARDSSLEDNTLQSPVTDAPPPSFPPPVPNAPISRTAPPPIPTQPPPENKRRSVDAPRAAPPPPPPANPTPQDEDFDPYSYGSPTGGPPSSYAHKTPRIEEEAYFPSVQSPGNRAPPPPPSAPTGRNRQSMDVPRTSMAGKRSGEMPRPSMALESGFIANDIDLAVQSGWWKQSNQVPPVLQGRRDIFFETQESTTNNRGAKTVITRTVTVLFQDYSQTILTAQYDPYDPSDVELDQSHEPPPRPLRQDQMEEYYERFGRHISEQVSAKKDSIVGDGTPQGLIYELLKPYRDVLLPVGTRAYGALVYSNMANASTQQHDVIRAGDILSIRNAKFQGKHGPMHAKYTAEVGKPDHVAVVAEWDGTKKKVRAWEQGRESKKVKMESFKLDDLRSGEVKIWRVMPRSWLGWTSQP